MFTGRRTRAFASLTLALSAASIAAGSVAAHSQTVDPNGNGDGFTRPIARAWVQAHCHSAAPALVSDASNGVVDFSPSAALPCSASVTNPGGQVTGP